MIEQGSSFLSNPKNGRHLISETSGFANAIDVVAYEFNDEKGKNEVSWAWPLYHKINDAFKRASEITRIPYEWGGNWSGKKADGPHFQLPRRQYP